MSLIPTQIESVLVTRLGAITEANGYSFDVSEVVQPRRDGSNWKYKHQGIGIVRSTDEPNEEYSSPGNPPSVGSRLTINIMCILKQSENDETGRSVGEDEMVLAVKKATVASLSDWYTFGGLSINAQFGTTEPFNGPEGEFSGVALPLIIDYAYSETDPSQVRS